MREHDHGVPDGHRVERHVGHGPAGFAVGHGRHAAGEGREGRRRPPDGEPLERLPAGEHEDDQRPRQVLAKDDGRDDRDAG